jgi:nucleotide-binding universal stress UspA family protein
MTGTVLEQHARYADLTIFARSDEDSFEAEMAETVLFGSGRPVLVVPPKFPKPFLADHVLIGWNGEREASRAVADALPFLYHAKAVQVLTVATEAGDVEACQLDAEDLARYLARHGVNVSAKTVVARGAAPEDLLLNVAADAGADLLVIGGYGHGRFREFVLGGVTHSLLRHATLPVMMSH